MQRWMMTHEMCKSHKETEHLWKQARFTSCQVINHVQRILVCGNLQKEWPADDRATMVPVFKCPLASRFGCNAEMKVTDSTSYINC